MDWEWIFYLVGGDDDRVSIMPFVVVVGGGGGAVVVVVVICCRCCRHCHRCPSTPHLPIPNLINQSPNWGLGYVMGRDEAGWVQKETISEIEVRLNICRKDPQNLRPR